MEQGSVDISLLHLRIALSLIVAAIIGGLVIVIFERFYLGGYTFIVTWIVLLFLIRRYSRYRVWVGSFLIMIGASCLLIPFALFWVVRRMIGMFEGMVGMAMLGVLMIPMGLFLITRGLHRLRVFLGFYQPTTAPIDHFCYYCGAPMSYREQFCPRCRSQQPQITARQKGNHYLGAP